MDLVTRQEFDVSLRNLGVDFGTLVLPNEEIRKNLILGVGIGAPQHHSTFAKVYLEPLASMYEILTPRFQSTRLTP